MKKIFTLLCLIPLCLGLAACGTESPEEQNSDPLENVPVTDAYDGIWSDGNGTVLSLDSAGRNYLLQVPSGRCGRGSYFPKEGEPTLSFDGDTYALTSSGESFTLTRAGAGSGTESLDGMTFSRDDWAELNYASVSVLDGSWNTAEGMQISIFTDQQQFEVVSGSSGALSDDGNGKGYYLKSGDTKVYLALSSDKSSFTTIGGESVGLAGTFLRSLAMIGKNDAATLALYPQYYDTWYQYASTARASVTLRADGTWESYDHNRARSGEGTFYISEDGTVALYDTARKFMGTVSIDAKDQLYYAAEDSDHDDEHPYSRSSVSY